jgi:hypothetical protein
LEIERTKERSRFAVQGQDERTVLKAVGGVSRLLLACRASERDDGDGVVLILIVSRVAVRWHAEARELVG